jgi:hypothetical protein
MALIDMHSNCLQHAPEVVITSACVAKEEFDTQRPPNMTLKYHGRRVHSALVTREQKDRIYALRFREMKQSGSNSKLKKVPKFKWVPNNVQLFDGSGFSCAVSS